MALGLLSACSGLGEPQGCKEEGCMRLELHIKAKLGFGLGHFFSRNILAEEPARCRAYSSSTQ